MMKRLLLVGLVLGIAAPAAAQSTAVPCPITGTTAEQARRRATQDACQQAVDLFQYMVPQLGVAITGGNATLGQGGALGGFGHFSVGLRANVLQGNVPQVDRVTVATTGRQQRTNYPTKDQFLGLPTVDAAIGVFKGVPLGLTNVGGVDLLVSAAYVPKYEADEVTVDPDTPLKLGYGVRIGAIQESLLLPGVSFTYLRRDLPKTTITGNANGASMTVNDLDVQTTAWRFVASKSLILFNIAAGVGQDTYDSKTTVQGTVAAGSFTSDAIPMSQKLTRTNYFADVSLNFLLAKLIGEVGMVSGGTVETYNQFDTDPAKSRLYGSVGVRIGF